MKSLMSLLAVAMFGMVFAAAPAFADGGCAVCKAGSADKAQCTCPKDGACKGKCQKCNCPATRADTQNKTPKTGN